MTTRVSRRVSAGRPPAFTAIEMLIVIFIISLLAAFLIVAVSGIRVGAQEKASTSIIKNLKAACGRYFQWWSEYPPDNFTELGVDTPPGHVLAYSGAECLVIALTAPENGGPAYPDIARNRVEDKDGDGLNDARFTYWEFVDGWGVPLRYQNLGDTVGVRILSAGRDGLFSTPDDLP